MENKFRIITQNLSYKSGDHRHKGLLIVNRSKDLFEALAENRPDIICFQEATEEWRKYLPSGLTDYDFVAVSRDNGDNPESCPIFYKKSRLSLVDTKTFWLSETPDVMSKVQTASHYRICTFALLKDIVSGTEIAVFNTHLDVKSMQARELGIRVILEKIQELADGKHVLLVGDFNTIENQGISYKLASEVLNDAKFISRYTMNGKTFQNFGKGLGQYKYTKPIDFVFVDKSEDVTVNNYKIIKSQRRKGAHYYSDHNGLLVDVEY